MKYFLLPRTTLLLPLRRYADLKGHALYRPDESLWLTKKVQQYTCVYIYTAASNINIVVVVLLVYSAQRQRCGRFSSGQTPFALLRLDCLHTQAEALDPSPPLALLDEILLSDFSSNLHLPARPVNDVHELPSFRPIRTLISEHQL